MIRQPVL